MNCGTMAARMRPLTAATAEMGKIDSSSIVVTCRKPTYVGMNMGKHLYGPRIVKLSRIDQE